MNTKFQFIKPSVFYLFLLLAGCAPMAEIELQVMNPAEITMPLHVNQLAFMNRSVFPHLIQPDTAGWTFEEFYILDTIMSKRIFQGVRTAMNESPLYELDTLAIIAARRSDKENILEPLGRIDLKNLRLGNPADALISLEYYNLDDSIDVGVFFEGSNYYYEAYMGIYTTCVWRIYDLTMDTVFDEFVLRDTAVWYGYAETSPGALEDLPLAINAIRTAAYEVGKRYGYRISPGWIDVPRFYYKGGSKEMRMASEMADLGDWQAAAEDWKELSYNQENAKLAAKACFNMALVCEMEDLLLPALDWAIKSYALRQESLTKEYIDLLQRRYEDRKKLKSQLPELDQ